MQTKCCAATVAAAAGLALLLGGCAETPPDPTRPPVGVATVVAAATIKAGGKPGGPPATGGSPGAQLFSAQGCQGCHTIKGQGGAIGPDLSTIGTTAATRKPGMDAAAYIRESIVNPGAFVVPGFQPGLMPTTFGTTLTPEQIDQLVSYLLEQK